MAAILGRAHCCAADPDEALVRIWKYSDCGEAAAATGGAIQTFARSSSERVETIDVRDC